MKKINKGINVRKVRKVCRPQLPQPCSSHNMMNKKLGYIEWHEWADKKGRMGHKQRQCPECKFWLFKCEV